MGTLFKKKSSLPLLITIILLVGVTGYMFFNKRGDKDINKNLLKAVTEIEISTYKLNTLKITYDEFQRRTDNYLSKYIPSFYKSGNIIYAENKFVSLIAGREYLEEDWKGMSLEEMKKIGEPLRQSLVLNMIDYNYKTSEISKVYEDNNSDNAAQFKHIFVKHILQIDNQSKPSYKQYTFKKEGSSYVLFSIRLVQANDEELSYNNNAVEFIKNINL